MNDDDMFSTAHVHLACDYCNRISRVWLWSDPTDDAPLFLCEDDVPADVDDTPTGTVDCSYHGCGQPAVFDHRYQSVELCRYHLDELIDTIVIDDWRTSL